MAGCTMLYVVRRRGGENLVSWRRRGRLPCLYASQARYDFSRPESVLLKKPVFIMSLLLLAFLSNHLPALSPPLPPIGAMARAASPLLAHGQAQSRDRQAK